MLRESAAEGTGRGRHLENEEEREGRREGKDRVSDVDEQWRRKQATQARQSLSTSVLSHSSSPRLPLILHTYHFLLLHFLKTNLLHPSLINATSPHPLSRLHPPLPSPSPPSSFRAKGTSACSSSAAQPSTTSRCRHIDSLDAREQARTGPSPKGRRGSRIVSCGYAVRCIQRRLIHCIRATEKTHPRVNIRGFGSTARWRTSVTRASIVRH